MLPPCALIPSVLMGGVLAAVVVSIVRDRARSLGAIRRGASRFMRGVIGDCPACEGDAAGHELRVLAELVSTAAAVQLRAAELHDALDDHRFADAAAVREFRTNGNGFVAWVLRCPSRNLAVLMERLITRRFGPADWLRVEVLDADESVAARRTARPFEPPLLLPDA